MQLTFSAARAHGNRCFVFKFLFTSTPGPFLQSYFQPFRHQFILLHKAFPSKMQDFAFAFIEQHDAPLSLLLSLLRSLLNSSPATQNTNCFPRFGLICAHSRKHAISSSRALIKTFKQYWSQYWSPKHATSDRLPTGL